MERSVKTGIFYAVIMTALFNLVPLCATMSKDSMNVLCIMHADFETPGVIQDWAEQNKYQFTVCKPYAGENCLEYNDFDFLIVMGGPQGGSDWHTVSYLADEVQLIQRAIAANKKVLGFCLGAQLIGEALGSKTEKSPEKEVGVYPIALTHDALQDPVLKHLSQELLVIHWHNDMPGETATSKTFASSAGCPRQIIKYSDQVYGFQCHLEITKKGIQRMISECPQDLAASRFTQTQEELLVQNYEAINQSMLDVLDAMSGL